MKTKKKNSAMLIYYYITHSQPTAAPKTMKHKNKRTNKLTNKAKKKERNRTHQNSSIKETENKTALRIEHSNIMMNYFL